MFPLSVECHRGALVPQLPLNAVMTTSSGFAGFIAIDVSPSLKVSVFVRFGSVLFTTASTIKTPGMRGIAFMPLGAESSGIAGRV
jgi:hypothetical protein